MTDELELENNLNTFVDEAEILASTQINPTNLDDELIRMASLYGRFGISYARARQQRDRCKTQLELTEAALDRKVRERAIATGEKTTEGKIRAEMVVQRSYIKAANDLNEANAISNILETTLKALEMKRDMLVQLNKNAEREWQYSSALVPREEMKSALNDSLARLKNTA